MPQTAGSSALKSGERFTVEQRNSWPENERWELIDGQAYGMSPVPRVPHQMLVGIFFQEAGRVSGRQTLPGPDRAR
ncbi:MAG TPA: hypothetical protein PLC54_05415 [Spirochaetales bacterium]|nr:hypothetical protein [Spirochaetales bacterium]